MSLLGIVLATIRRHALVPAGGRVAVALSGGPDSVALLHLLRALEAGGHLAVAGVAHFNHQLRADASDDDERFCRDLASRLGLPFEAGRADVRDVARRARRSIEDAARDLRYAFLREAAGRFGAASVAVGHSRDDQAETFLLRILRGAGTRGLGGIRPKAGVIIRPLLDIARADLRAYAAQHGLAYRDDATNADLSVPRNRVRHVLLPHLEREFAPNIVEVLAREAAVARDDDDYLEAAAIKSAGSVVLTTTPPDGQAVVHLDREGLGRLHPAIAARVVRCALGTLAGGRFIGFDHVDAVRALVAEGRAGQALSLPGQRALVREEVVVLGPEPPRGVVVAEANSFEISLSIPGEVVIGPQRLAVSADWAEGQRLEPHSHDAAVLVTGLRGSLTVRSRKPGDRFHPPGLGGRSKKLQDYLVDRKVARSERDRLPLVVDADGRIIWVVGHAVAEGFGAPAPSAGVILLKARHLGGEV